jgi:hypothetical protein
LVDHRVAYHHRGRAAAVEVDRVGQAQRGLVFGTVLASRVHLTGLALLVTIAFHYASPAATVVGWLLFGPRSRIGWAVVGWAFVWPVAVVLALLLKGVDALRPRRIGMEAVAG